MTQSPGWRVEFACDDLLAFSRIRHLLYQASSNEVVLEDFGCSGSRTRVLD